MAFSYTQAVRMGAKLLDTQAPGWQYKVKITDLDMSNGDRCILGQTFGEFLKGERFLWPDKLLKSSEDQDMLAERHGFLVADGIMGDDTPGVRYTEVYDRLGTLWADEVRKRRGRSGTRGKRKPASQVS